ncbi:peptidyl-tRNA hydrolase PTH2-domain-containing protein [Apodospora peruviana]|uniref:peptidyl-tRNA hydrolase n=1 Tax=Apodospora peruviana TaxID=516989 RepID=A0AAE0HY47_9PEZI|nr:peptidyl-tRNA hydrolase PTH2-domain-containing protein [Apodospora peruviana]
MFSDVQTTSTTVVSTSIVTFVSGLLLGIYAVRGYLISPALKAERHHNLYDPLESEESDIDEDDTILDHAPNWSNGEEADRRQGLRAGTTSSSAQAAAASSSKTKSKTPAAVAKPAAEPKDREECKLVLVVRTDLGMTKGKIAAQCSHATLACYKALLRAAQKAGETSPEARLLRQWERFGQAKIAVQTKSQDEMLELMGKARSVGVTAEVIADAGRTQIESGSLTVLGVGPAPKSEVDKITGHLKLL